MMEAELETNTQTGSARVLIVDDNHFIRHGFHRMLGLTPDLEVVGEASNGRKAVELCRSLRPDLVLMDVNMPEMDGLAATRAIKREHPEIAILMVTMYENPDYLLEALEAGAAGYVLKDAPTERLINAIHRTLNGESPLNQELATQLLRRLAEERMQSVPEVREPRKAQRKALREPLTPREEEVLQLLASGQTNQQIARTLVISKGTVKVHVERIIRKLGASDRTQAVVHG
ncbi:MAG: response regulator transcription factor, partial [Actinomycetota bacterium]|nr:response regulator transcription factor [Actinomycetota bacterium]